MKKFAAALLFAVLLAPAFPQPGLAQDHDDHDRGHEHANAHEEHGHGGAPHGDFHPDEHWHGDIHAFHEHDIDYWHSGHWFHGPHDGRNGWWWTLGGSWYYYPAPIYPYPDPYAPPMMAPPPAAVSYWYYCPNPRGYYPYVPVCYGPWHEVPAY